MFCNNEKKLKHKNYVLVGIHQECGNNEKKLKHNV